MTTPAGDGTQVRGMPQEGINPVHAHDLPFACPPRQADRRMLHPRVFLPFEQPGEVLACPYCGAQYQLVE